MIVEACIAASLIVGPTDFPPLSWFGEDKLKHFVASFVVGSLSASGARGIGIDRTAGIAVGAGIAATAGLLKELHDARRGEPFSGYDLLWDAAGIAAAAGLQDATR